MLYQGTNISAMFENAVQRMSSYIRNIVDKVHQAVVAGTSQVWATHIKIQWTYITIPAITLLVGYIHVILTFDRHGDAASGFGENQLSHC